MSPSVIGPHGIKSYVSSQACSMETSAILKPSTEWYMIFDRVHLPLNEVSLIGPLLFKTRCSPTNCGINSNYIVLIPRT